MINIKNAIIFSAQLPKADALGEHLKESAFQDLGAMEFSRAGFESMFDGLFVAPFPGGYAFKLRYDEKIIPASVTTELAIKRIQEIETEENRRLPRKERQAIRDKVVEELLPKALCSTKRITCFYRTESNLLIVPTTSKKIADIVTSRLIRSVGSIKATTIHVSDIKAGLTGKLRAYLEGNSESFVEFSVGGRCKLKEDESGKTAQFKNDYIDEAKEGIIESIKTNARVVELELVTDCVEFRINSDFIIKGIRSLAEPEDIEFDDEKSYFEHEASVQTMILDDVVKKLCTVFEYKAQESKEAA